MKLKIVIGLVVVVVLGVLAVTLLGGDDDSDKPKSTQNAKAKPADKAGVTAGECGRSSNPRSPRRPARRWLVPGVLALAAVARLTFRPGPAAAWDAVQGVRRKPRRRAKRVRATAPGRAARSR